jgi:hypothetical protein
LSFDLAIRDRRDDLGGFRDDAGRVSLLRLSRHWSSIRKKVLRHALDHDPGIEIKSL